MNNRTYPITLLLFTLLLILQSCSESAYNESTISEEKTTEANSESQQMTAGINIAEFAKTHRITKTVNFTIENEDVLNKSALIERAVATLGGLIMNNKTETIILERELLKTGLNAAEEIIRYAIDCQMTISIPEHKLDSMITIIQSDNVFIHQKHTKAEDLRWRIIKAAQSEHRNNAFINNSTALSASKASIDNMSSVQNIKYWNEEKDEAMLERLQLEDQLAYSVIHVNLKQAPKFKSQPFAPHHTFAVGFIVEMKNGLIEGFEVLRALIIFFISTWGLWIIGGFVWLAYKSYRKYKSKKFVKA